MLPRGPCMGSKGWASYLSLPSLARPGRVVGQQERRKRRARRVAESSQPKVHGPWSVRSHITGVSYSVLYVPRRAVTGASLLFLDAIVPSTPDTSSYLFLCPPDFPSSFAFSIVPPSPLLHNTHVTNTARAWTAHLLLLTSISNSDCSSASGQHTSAHLCHDSQPRLLGPETTSGAFLAPASTSISQPTHVPAPHRLTRLLRRASASSLTSSAIDGTSRVHL